jgi:hypothetical protein
VLLLLSVHTAAIPRLTLADTIVAIERRHNHAHCGERVLGE